jgi:4-amino-4-deoxy-L-arabinose transferase-like glycosyltransferase
VNRQTAGRWWPPALILLGAAVLRAAYLVYCVRNLPFHAHPFGDAEIYLDWARQIAAGGPTAGVFYRAPLYPYFVALAVKAGAGVWPVYIVQMLLGLATTLLVYHIARRLFGPSAALVALALAALCAPLAFFESKLLSATLVVFFITLGSYLLTLVGDRRQRWVWLPAGIIFGAAAVAWAGAAFIFPLACIWAVAGRTAGRKGVWLGVAGCLLVIGAVTARNATVGQDFVPISYNGGFTLYQGNNRLAAGTLAQPPEMFEFKHEGRFLTAIAEQEQFEKLYAESLAGHALRPSQISAFWAGRAVSWIIHNPGAFALLLGRKLVLALSDYESPSDYNLDLELRTVWPLRLAFVRLGLLLALAVAGLLLSRGRQYWPLYAVLLGTLAALLIFYVVDRYRLPAYPALAALAGAGAHKLWRAARFRELRPWPVAVGAALLLLSTVAFTLPLRRGSELLRAGAYRNLAEVWQYRSAEPKKAEAAYRTAIDIYRWNVNPASRQERLAQAETCVLLARLYAEAGRQDLAEAAVQEAAALNTGLALPEFGPNRLELARAALAQADTAQAIARLSETLAADSSSHDAYLMLGGLLGARGQHEQAFDLLSLATRRFPEDPALLFNLALAALNAGHYQVALDRAEQVLKLVPGHPWARTVAARARAKLSR